MTVLNDAKFIYYGSAGCEGVYLGTIPIWLPKAPDDAAATMQHTGTGQFTITNFDGSRFTYTPEILSGGGGATVSGAGVVSLTPANASMRIHTTYIGVPPDREDLRVTGQTCERKAITYNRCEWVQTGWEQKDGPCTPGCTCYGTCGPGSQNCGCSIGYNQCGLEDNVPGGFTKAHGEWARVY